MSEADFPPAYTEIADQGTTVVAEGAGVPFVRSFNIQTNRMDQSPLPEQSFSSYPVAAAPVRRVPVPTPISTVPQTTFNIAPSPSSPNVTSPVARIPPPIPPRPYPITHNRTTSGASSITSAWSEKSDGYPYQTTPSGSMDSTGHERTASLGGTPQPDIGSSIHDGVGISSFNSTNQPQSPKLDSALPSPTVAPGKAYLKYPPYFFCKNCHNTGVKVRKGTSCKSCWNRYGVSGTSVQTTDEKKQPLFSVPSLIVAPNDVSTSATKCGRCRGKGQIRDFMIESSCPICHGVGHTF